MATSTKIRKGNDLMLFYSTSTSAAITDTSSTAESMAFATNHTLTVTTETDEIQSKDSGYNGAVLAKRVTWEIQSENLYIDADYTKVVTDMLGKKYVDVVFGVAKDGATSGTATTEDGITATDAAATTGWKADTTYNYFYGKAMITSLTLNTNAGENSTYSVTLTGSGSLLQKEVK